MQGNNMPVCTYCCAVFMMNCCLFKASVAWQHQKNSWLEDDRKLF